MSVLSGKNILLGVTAGIAAYKSAHLVRLFIKAGANVKVVMTPASKDFITPLTLATLSKNPVYSSFYNDDNDNSEWNNHVELGLWADLMVIAPATANTMSKMVNGNCDNLLIATYLSAKCPIYFAPAMDLDMYKHPSTIASFSALKKFGNTIIPAESGELASGLSGEGRMAEPENIIAFLEADLESKLPLQGKKILITAGPTYESIDPVRFIGNHSTGKMGYDIAIEAANKGADVILISGPTYLSVNHSNIKILTNQEIISIEKLNNEWTLKTKDQKNFNTNHVAICNARYLHQFDLTQHLHTDAFRGQINWVNSTPFQMPSIVICDEGYLAPRMQNKHIFGATYGMNDFNKDLRLSDTKKNIASIKKIHREFYSHCLAQKTISGRVSWRASTKDRKPYVGRVFNNELFKKMRVRELAQTDQLPWLDNLYVASGFGSRGFTFAPYCTFVLANLINKNLSKEDKETLNYTNPERYRLKKMSLKKAASRIFKV